MAEVWEEDRRIRKFLDPKRKQHKKVESLVKFIDGAASADHVTRLFAKYSTGAWCWHPLRRQNIASLYSLLARASLSAVHH